MTTQFHALRLNQSITDAVVKFSASNCVDLNTVDRFTDTMIIVGDHKTGLQIHVRQHEAVCDTPAGVYVTLFNEEGNTHHHVNIEGVTL